VGWAAAIAGCGSQDSIARYAVPKEDIPDIASTDPSAPEPRAWFFKLLGPAESVGKVQDEFTALVESVRFEDGKPRWSLPEGWSQSGASQMRFATLKVDGADPALEVSVTMLPVFGSDLHEYVRQNVDRWRGQVRLPPTSGPDWMVQGKTAGALRESSAGDVPVTFVDLVGKTDDADPARMLGAVLLPDAQASTVSGALNPSRPPSRTPHSTSSSLTFDVPDGWEPGKASTMRAASFAVTDAGQQVDISALRAGGNELDNVNRWREQVGLEAVTQAELDETVREIEVDGRTGRMFELVGDAQAIFAVIVPADGASWFFKMMGDPALADRERANFESFVTSVRFP
jgi:hypothetical protein